MATFFIAVMAVMFVANTATAQLTITFTENQAAGTTLVSFTGSAPAPFAIDTPDTSEVGQLAIMRYEHVYNSDYMLYISSKDRYYGANSAYDWRFTSGAVPWTGPSSITTYNGAVGGGGFILQFIGSSELFYLYSNSTEPIAKGATMTWDGYATMTGDLSSFGLTPGSGAFTIGNGTDSVTINWTAGATAVPEPSTYAAILGLGGLAFALWRRRQTRASA